MGRGIMDGVDDDFIEMMGGTQEDIISYAELNGADLTKEDLDIQYALEAKEACGFGCPNCGGNLIGDGFTMVLHCENADLPVGIEPDANVIYCK
jgi:hypothetical protein